MIRATEAAIDRPALFIGAALVLAAASGWGASHLAVRSSFEELLPNLYEAIEGSLSVDIAEPKLGGNDRVLEIAI